MLESTYAVLAEKKERLRSRANELSRPDDGSRFHKLWRSMDFQEGKGVVGAEDGSINHKHYKGFALYAVNALALVCDGGIKEYAASDVNIIHPFLLEERLGLYRSIFELKTSLKALGESDVFLIDGSLSSDLGTPRSLGFELDAEEKAEALALVPKLEGSLEDGVRIAAHDYADEFVERKSEKLVFLEYLEYLLCLSVLLEKGLDKLVGVSKTSRISSLVEGVSDMALFEGLTREPGFSRPRQEPLASKIHREFPIYDELFNSLVFTSFYTRLEKNKGMLRVEVPKEIEEEEAIQLLEKMRSVSVNGYPYPLRKAHRGVVITNRDMERILKSLSIVAKTGREVL